MGNLKAWERVTGFVNIDDPKEAELAEKFNETYTKLFCAVKENRRAAIELLKALSDLNNHIINDVYAAGAQDQRDYGKYGKVI